MRCVCVKEEETADDHSLEGDKENHSGSSWDLCQEGQSQDASNEIAVGDEQCFLALEFRI